jgi:hypothetical protein
MTGHHPLFLQLEPLPYGSTPRGRVGAQAAHPFRTHKADRERAAAQSTFTNSLKLLRQARERLGQGLRAVAAGTIAEPDEISLGDL